MTTIQIDVTADEIKVAKRAVVVLSEMALIAVKVSSVSEPIEIKQDRLSLIKLIRKLEAAIGLSAAGATGHRDRPRGTCRPEAGRREANNLPPIIQEEET